MFSIFQKRATMTGIDILDEQHKIIFSTISTLEFMIDHGDYNDTMVSILSIVSQYTKIHFSVEESLLRNAKYSNYSAHETAHSIFISDLYKQTFAAKESMNMRPILSFLKHWWVEHINKVDMQYSEFLVNAIKADKNILNMRKSSL